MRPHHQFTSPPVRGNGAGAGSAARLPLSSTEVEVWRVALDDQPAEVVSFMATLLSRDEAERAQRFFFARDRGRFLVGRGMLRMTLARYLERAPQELVFRYGPNGKPALAAEVGDLRAHAPLYFNVAHSEGLALFAVTRAGEIGIDVEWMRELPDWEQVAGAAFSARELAQLRACPPVRRRDEFFRAWTRQEAVLKALGTGLGGLDESAAQTSFQVYPLEVAPGFAAALAANPAARQPVEVLEWNTKAAAQPEAAPHAKRAPQLNFP